MQTFIDIAKMVINANLQLAVLHYPKCKAVHIDTPNSVANIKHQVHCTKFACKHIFLCPDSQTVSIPIALLHPKLQDNKIIVKHPHTKNCWENLCDSYIDVFQKPGYLVDRSTKHRIDLIDKHK